MTSDQHPLPKDCLPWLTIAKAVLAGDMNKADRSTRDSIIIGLRNIQHQDCKAATAKLILKTSKT